jgi:hypothetical protein
MKQIHIPDRELWDEEKRQFINIKGQTITLEHSLVSISKWESKWHVPFFSKEEKTNEMLIDYVRAMTITQNVNPDIYNYLTRENFEEINKYIDDPYTATTFRKDNGRPNREVITSEVIYYWMIYWNIPFECQRWHINRLITLIRVCGLKNQPQKKMSQREILSQNAALNAARRKKFNTRG